MIKKIGLITSILTLLTSTVTLAQNSNSNGNYTIFDEAKLLKRGAEKYKNYEKEILLAMIEDDALPSSYQRAAAVLVFKQKYSSEIFSKEKKGVEKTLLRRLNKTDSPFVQVEIMHTLCLIDRYKYFKSLVPVLIQKMDHYNVTVNSMAYSAMNDIVKTGSNRTREARIVFNTLRKILFLSKKRLNDVTEPDERLTQKLTLLRWSIKVLGNQELKKLPKEVINLL